MYPTPYTCPSIANAHVHNEGIILLHASKRVHSFVLQVTKAGRGGLGTRLYLSMSMCVHECVWK